LTANNKKALFERRAFSAETKFPKKELSTNEYHTILFLKRLENALDKAVLKVRKILVYTPVHKLSKP